MRARSASFSGGARPASTNSDGKRIVMALCLLWIDNRRPQHLLDALRVGCEYHQPIESERNARRMRHLRERREEILIERIALAVPALFLHHLRFKTAALFGWIGEFAECVRD